MPQGNGEDLGPVYRPRADVIVTDLEGEVILLDPVSVEMYSLGNVACMVWQALPGTPDELATAIVSTYDVEYQQALEDIHTMLHELSAIGLVESSGV